MSTSGSTWHASHASQVEPLLFGEDLTERPIFPQARTGTIQPMHMTPCVHPSMQSEMHSSDFHSNPSMFIPNALVTELPTKMRASCTHSVSVKTNFHERK